MAKVLAIVLLYAKSNLLSAILLFVVTLGNFSFSWATVIMWVCSQKEYVGLNILQLLRSTHASNAQ